MADKKISQLTGATTPVAGTEVLPIVQGGNTVKVSIDNVTKGRVVNALTFDTDVAAAGVTLTGITLAADGTDTNIDINITPKGTGEVNIPKVDIDGGAIDGTPIGANSASTGAFSTLSASGNVTLSGGTANGVLYLDGSKVTTSGTGLAFDGTNLSVVGGNATINRSTNATVLTLGGSPSANWEGDIRFLTSNNQINWRLASNREVAGTFTITPSTTTGGATFTTPAVTVNTSSNVGLGTTSPNQKLEVVGNLRFSGAQVGSKIESRQNAISVSTATTILDDAGAYGRLVIVNGSDSNVNRFCDLVLASSGAAPTVVSSFTAIGSPAARTYTRSGAALQLAMASGTYDVFALALGF